MPALDEILQPFLPRRNLKGPKILFLSKYLPDGKIAGVKKCLIQVGWLSAVLAASAPPSYSWLEITYRKWIYFLFCIHLFSVRGNGYFVIRLVDYLELLLKIFGIYFCGILYKMKGNETCQLFLGTFIWNEICQLLKKPQVPRNNLKVDTLDFIWFNEGTIWKFFFSNYCLSWHYQAMFLSVCHLVTANS